MSEAVADVRSAGNAPGPRGSFLLGSLNDRRTRPLEFFRETADRYGPVVQYWMGPPVGGVRVFLVNRPEHVHHVLQGAHAHYRKGMGYDELRVFMGNGLLTSEGDHWRKQRKLAQPAFHQKSLMQMTGTMAHATEQMLARWERELIGGEPFDVAREMMRLTLRIAGETLFSVDVSQEADRVGQAVSALIEYANDVLLSPLRIPIWIPTPRNREASRQIADMNRLIHELIAERRKKPEGFNDLLSLLLASRDEETGEGMSDSDLRDEVITLFVAGHETTANALSWTLKLLSEHPEWEQRAREEARKQFGDRSPTFEDAMKLPIIHAIVQESMRLYPPAWVIARTAAQDDVIGGFRIPKDSIVLVSPYVMHRTAEFWPDPDRFDPARFLASGESPAPQHARYSYFPFGGGPRVCIGSQFAMVETQLLLGLMLRRFKIRIDPSHPIIPEPLITLRPRNGMRVTIEKA